MNKQAYKSYRIKFFENLKMQFCVRGRFRVRKYSLYSIKTIKTIETMECPHNDWNTSVCVWGVCVYTYLI